MRFPFLVVLLMVCAPAICRAEAEVNVKKESPTVKRIFFDAKILPKEMPKLRQGEAAVCQFNFNVSVNVKYRVVDTRKTEEGIEVDCEIGKADLVLTLENRIFLPRGAPLRLRSHEEAHREISERIYANAEAIAKEETAALVKRTWTGKGKTAEEAGKDATNQAISTIGKAVLAKTADESEKVNAIFDRITEHGKLEKPPIAEAIKQSFAEHEKQATTQP